MNSNLTIGPSFNGDFTAKVVRGISPKGRVLYDTSKTINERTFICFDSDKAFHLKRLLKKYKNKTAIEKNDLTETIRGFFLNTLKNIQLPEDTHIVNLSSPKNFKFKVALKNSNPKPGDTHLFYTWDYFMQGIFGKKK